MQSHSTVVSDYDAVFSHVPLAGQLRPATTVCAALAYARVSKSIQTTIPAQFQEITKLGSKLCVPILRQLSDQASGMKADREGYQELIEEAATERYSHVLLFRADRLARDSAELQTTVKRLWRMGVKVFDTSVGELTDQNLPILALLAELEIRTLSERTDMGLRYAAEEGHKLGSLPLGYAKGTKPGEPQVDPVLGPAVSELFRRAAQGATSGEMQGFLLEKTGRRVDWRTIKRLLHNPYYAGMVVNFRMRRSILDGVHARERQKWIQTTHSQPLVDVETWLAVQDRLQAASYVGQHRSQPSRYALCGILWCSTCNRRMEGNTGGAGRGRNYRCPLCRLTRSCNKVERAVRRALEYAVLTDENEKRARSTAVEQQRSQAQAELAVATVQIERLTLKRQKLYQRLDEGIIDAEQYRAQVAALDKERASWQERQAAHKQQLARVPAVPDKSDIDWTQWTALLATKDVASQQRIYRHCCTAIRLDIAANTLMVRYTPQVLYLVRAEERTEPL